ELVGPALPEPGGMNYRIDAPDRTRQARRLCDVALDELATPGSQPGSPAQVTDEAADGQVAASQLVDDMASHEAGPPRHQDQPVVSFWKFCQYLDGVGPRWPWYLEPMSPVPYGVAAGSVSCTK